jgi:PAT family beta-lactamase induction signal transducer AmpG
MKSLPDYLQAFASRRIAAITLLGFSSGLPLALTSGTLQAWMTVSGVDIRTIGIFALVGLPYTIKFLWSPLMDRFVPLQFGGRIGNKLGRRRGWILLTQICLIIGITTMAFNSPQHYSPYTLWLLGIIALSVASASASQDIVIDAYRTDTLREKERGIGAGVFVSAYRIAMLISGAVALILSEHIGWRNTYLLMAGLMSIGVITTLFAPEPEVKTTPPKSLREAVWGPLKNYFSRKGAIAILLLIILYKLGDAYAGTLTTAFLIRGVGFSPGEVGAINKGLGLISTIFGAMFGGALMVRLGLFKSLMIFGILQAISNLTFMALALIGKNYGMLIFAVAFENLCGGMGTAAFISLLMTICSQKYSATQYALLSSLAALGRIFVAPSSGFVVVYVGWANFFFITFLTALPGLWLLFKMKHIISNLKQNDSDIEN